MTPYSTQVTTAHFPIVSNTGKQDHYPLSAAQERIFVMSHFKGAEISHNNFRAFRVQGHLNILLLEAACRTLISRHESLRTSFSIVDDEPVQIVHDIVTFQLECHQIKEEDIPVQLSTFTRKFNPEQAPLFRAGVLEISDTNYMLLLNIHQLICDDFSLDILYRELWEIYHGKQLPELSVHYRDYAVWQQSLLKNGAFTAQAAFWKKQFEGSIPLTDLPLDFPRPSTQTFEGKDYSTTLHATATAGTLDLIHRKGIPLQSFMLSIYNILLAKYTSQDDIITGVPVAGRTAVGTAPVTGAFTNILAIRNAPKADKTFEEFLEEVIANTLAAEENQDYPFEELIKVLQLQRDARRSPLVDTLFQCTQSQEKIVHHGLQVTPFSTGTTIARQDLHFKVIQQDHNITIHINYNTALFTATSIQRLAKHYYYILSQVLENPAITLGAIALADEEELKQLQVFSGIPDQEVPAATLPDLWTAQVLQHKDRIAIATTDGQLSFEELDRQSTALAIYLQEVYQIRPGNRVAIMLQRSLHLPVAILAILKAGAAYVPIDPLFPVQRIEYILGNSGCSLIIADQQHRYELPLFNICGEKKPVSQTTLKATNITPSDLAYLIYTSGSTGVPKGAMLEHGNVVSLIRNIPVFFGLSSKDRILAISNITFDLSVFEILGSLLSGVYVFLVKEDEINDFVKVKEIILENKINVLQMTPSRIMLFLMAVGFWVLEGIEFLILGGEPMPKELFAVLRTLKGTRVFNSYGPTETGIYSIAEEIKDDKITIGKPLLNEQVFIMSEEGHRQPIHIAGEIYIAGPGVGRGYCNQETLTGEKFIRNSSLSAGRIYKTGDIGRWLPDGRIEYLGRKDTQVKIKGYRIELGEIENALMKMEGIRLAGAVVTPVKGEKQIALFYESAAALEDTVIRAFLAQYLPNYMLPLFCIHLDIIPLTSSGKVDRKSLEQLARDRQTVARPYEEPVGSLQKTLATIWKELLHKDSISAADNFFELGGNSIKLIQSLNRVKKDLGVIVPLTTAFTYPTIKDLSKKIEMIREFGNVSVEEHYSLANPGKKQTIFCFPPALGYSFAYTALGEYLPDYTLCSCHFIEDDNRMEQYETIMHEVAPDQPIILMGYSAGGCFAFEIAKALEAKGREVADIIMIDTYRRCEAKAKPPAILEETIRTYFSVVDWNMFSVEPDYLETLKKNTLSKISSYCRYMDGKMDDGQTKARLHILKSKEVWDTPESNREWGVCAPNGFYTHDGSGPHMGMLNPEYLFQNAGLITTIVERSDKNP